MAAAVDIGTLIESSPDLRHGRPRITGTGITVHRIAVWYQMGLTTEEIALKYGHLSLAQIHNAIAYYFANKTNVDREIAEDRAADDEAERDFVQDSR